MYEELIKALRLAADKQRFGNYPSITVDVETAYKLASALESMTGKLTALQAENAEKDKEIERLRAKVKQWRQTSEENFASCEKLQAALSRVETERDAANRYLKKIDGMFGTAYPNEILAVLEEWRGAQGEG